MKTAVKSKTGTTLSMSLKIFDGNDLSHELLLTTRQITKLKNAFNNNISTDIKLLKLKFQNNSVWRVLGALLGKLPGPLIKVAVPSTKDILAPLGITATASGINAGTQKKLHGSGTTTLIISNKEMNDIRKIVQAFEDSNILLKGVKKQLKIKQENKEEDF